MERLRAKIEPAWLTCWRLDLNNREFSRKAVGLVPVAGEPPILLSSTNLHRNAVQVGAADFVRRHDVVFSEDSLSVPEGLTLACWTPLLGKGKVVARSFSLREEIGLLKEALNEQEVTLLSGSSCFYAGLGEPVGGKMLKYALLFGPVLQREIKQWEIELGIPLCRAWSSHGRVATMSRPDPNYPSTSHHQIQIGRLLGSVGRFLPGIAVRVKGAGIQMRFDPVLADEIQGLWLDGPEQAELDRQGFLRFSATESVPRERAKKSP
jgi:hypothetical protein